MPKKGKNHNKSRQPNRKEYTPSENTPRDAAERLHANAGIDPATHHPGEYAAFPAEDLEEAPPYNIGGVGGRPTPRKFDDDWTPSEGTYAMGSKPKPDDESVAAPRGGYYAGESAASMEYEGAFEPEGSVAETPQEIYAELMKADLEERGIHIDQLMAHAQGTEANVRHAYLQQIENLRALQGQAEKALEGLSTAGSSAWEGMRDTVEDALGSLRSAVNDAMDRFYGSEEKSPEEEKR